MARPVGIGWKDEPAEMGPAMSALNDRQRAFVTEYILCGCATTACKRAGYGTPTTTPEIFGRLAYQLKCRDSIRLAIEEETRRYIRVLGPAAVSRLIRIITDPKTRDSDALRAIDTVLSRCDPIISGQVIQVNHSHSHRVQLSADQITKRILELAGRVGVALPPPVTIEATAEEVAP